VELAADRRKATPYYDSPLPVGSRIRATLDGSNLADAFGLNLDADGDGVAGRYLVHIDGPTAALNVPPGAYYPFVGKTWTTTPGVNNSLGDIPDGFSD